MTQKLVKQALELARSQEGRALEVLRGVTQDFLKKRLQPLIDRDDASGASARVLWRLRDLNPVVELRPDDLTVPAPPQDAAPATRPPRLIRFPKTLALEGAQRTPSAVSRSWLRYEEPPTGVPRFAVAHLAENTVEAEALARDELQRRIIARLPVAVDFRGIEVCTQSFLHALLYETLRLAWALQVEVYATQASPAVVSGLRLVENYALAG